MKKIKLKAAIFLWSAGKFSPSLLKAGTELSKIRMSPFVHLNAERKLQLTLGDFQKRAELNLSYMTKQGFKFWESKLSLNALQMKVAMPIISQTFGLTKPVECFFSFSSAIKKLTLSQVLGRNLWYIELNQKSSKAWSLTLGATQAKTFWPLRLHENDLKIFHLLEDLDPKNLKQGEVDNPQENQNVEQGEANLSATEEDLQQDTPLAPEKIFEIACKSRFFLIDSLLEKKALNIYSLADYLHLIFQAQATFFKTHEVDALLAATSKSKYKSLLPFYVFNGEFAEKASLLEKDSDFSKYLIDLSTKLEVMKRSEQGPSSEVCEEELAEESPFKEGFRKFSQFPELKEGRLFLAMISLFDLIDFDTKGQGCFEYIENCFKKSLLDDINFQYEKIYLPISLKLAKLSDEVFQKFCDLLNVKLTENLAEAFSEISNLQRLNNKILDESVRRKAATVRNLTLKSIEEMNTEQNLLKLQINNERANTFTRKPEIFSRFIEEAQCCAKALEERDQAKAASLADKYDLNNRFYFKSLHSNSFIKPIAFCSQGALLDTTQSGLATPQLEAEASSIEDETLSFKKLRDKEVDGLYSLPSSPLDSKSSAKKKEGE